MDNRRAFLQRAVFGVGAAALATTATLGTTAGAATGAVPGAPTPGGSDREATAPGARSDAGSPGAHWLLSPLREGSDLGLGWTLTAIYPPIQGAITLNVRHLDGRVGRIDLCLRDGAAKGPAASAFVDFIVMDGGDGERPMAESLGRVVAKLAAIVAANEERELDQLVALEPHADRVWRHADAMSAAPSRLLPGLG